MLRLLLPAAIATPLLVVAASAQPTPQPQSVTVSHPWAPATPGNAKTGAVYATLADLGQPDHLMGVSTPIAAMAELHETTNVGGVMRMRPVPNLVLEPGKPVTLAPGGYHIMLMGLKQRLEKGSHFPLTLTFEHAQPVTVQVEVEDLGARGPGQNSAVGHDMDMSMPMGPQHKP